MTMASAPAKFTFDLDLGRPRDHARLVTEDCVDAMVHQAGDDAYKKGLADGQASASAEAAKALTAAAERLAAQVVSMTEVFDTAQRKILQDAVHLASSIAHKLTETLIAREPQAEIDALLHECISSLRQCPHLVIRCHPDLADAMRDTADERLKTAGFTGRLVVLGEPDIKLGDARIEWAEGGVTRNSEAISAKIDAQVAAYLAARGHTEAEGTAND